MINELVVPRQSLAHPVHLGAVRLAIALAATVAAGGALIRLGEGDLGVPLTSSEDVQAWMDDTAPATIAMGLLRLVAIALCAYLTMALLANSVATIAARHRGASPSATRLLPSALRHLLVSASGIGLAGTALPLAAPTAVLAATPSDDDGVAVMVKLAPDEDGPTTSDVPESEDPLPGEAATDSLEPAEDPLPESPPSEPDSTEEDERDGQETWTVTPGDSFWSIAEETLAERAAAQGNQPPDDAAISKYWFELITANRDLLAQDDDPDLLFSGQALRLPPT